MACSCLSRHVEDRVIALDARATSLPWWRWRKRRELNRRVTVLIDVMIAALSNERER